MIQSAFSIESPLAPMLGPFRSPIREYTVDVPFDAAAARRASIALELASSTFFLRPAIVSGASSCGIVNNCKAVYSSS